MDFREASTTFGIVFDGINFSYHMKQVLPSGMAQRETGQREQLPSGNTGILGVAENRYLPMSGLSFLLSGLLVLIGTLFAWSYLGYEYEGNFETEQLFGRMEAIPQDYVIKLGFSAIVLVLCALGMVAFFNARRARQMRLPFWDDSARLALLRFSTPLIIGAAFGAILVFRYGLFGLAAPISLIFYGMALILLSTASLKEMRYLGWAEVLLGLISCLVPRESLIFWALGLGLFHVIFGAFLYYRYEYA